nr:hypothetical protein [Streptomyces sp. SA15]
MPQPEGSDALGDGAFDTGSVGVLLFPLPGVFPGSGLLNDLLVRKSAAVTAMALHAVVAGDVEEAAAYGLADAAKAFVDRGLVVQLAHRDIDRDFVHR